MTNKIPQEIEEKLTIREARLFAEGYDYGFKAGQKQIEDAFKEMILRVIQKEKERIYRGYIEKAVKVIPHIEGSLRNVEEELLSKIGDVQQTSEEKQDEDNSF